jgi:hypothetical protein
MKATFSVLLFAGVSLAQVSSGSLSARRALEAAASAASAHVVWSKPVGRLQSGETRAVFSAFSVTDPTRSGRQLRGIRVDLVLPDWSGVAYVEEAEVADLKKCADWLAKMAKTYPDVTDTFSIGGGQAEDPTRPFRLSYTRAGNNPTLYLAYLGSSQVRSLQLRGVPPSELAAIFASTVKALGR